MVVSVLFWYLVCQGMVALCWEAVHHWGSWLQRQYIDRDPFLYRDDDTRSRIEFYLPLGFYFWLWLVRAVPEGFGLLVWHPPPSWTCWAAARAC